jgi:hypothetical protein
MRCMSEEENRDVRRSALAIITLNQVTFPEFIKRTRDVDTNIRITVYKKLFQQRAFLANMKLCDIYKLIFDGIGSREEKV